MCRILIQTLALLGIALAAGYLHSRLTPVQARLPEQPPGAVEGAPKRANTAPPPTGPSGPTGAPVATGPTGLTGSTGPTGATPPAVPVLPPKPPNPPPASTGEVKPATADEGWFISVQRAKEIYDKNEAVFVDARTFDEYKEGHILNSMHMDKKYFDGAAGPMKARALKGQAVVIYCHGAECTDSQAVAQRFISLNYQIGPIHIIKEGFPGWVAAGYPVDKGPEVNW
jgi:rhodanese-related sulfurtransferase